MTNPFESVPYKEPNQIVVGDLVEWRKSEIDLDPALYDLLYVFREHASPYATIEKTATHDGSDFVISMTASGPEWRPGRWSWSSYAVRKSDSARRRIEIGTFDFLHDLQIESGDVRSHARRMLDMIEALMEGRATDDVDNYSIAGRQLTKMSVDELMHWRSHYKSEVETEENIKRVERGEASGSSVQMRFTGSF